MGSLRTNLRLGAELELELRWGWRVTLRLRSRSSWEISLDAVKDIEMVLICEGKDYRLVSKIEPGRWMSRIIRRRFRTLSCHGKGLRHDCFG